MDTFNLTKKDVRGEDYIIPKPPPSETEIENLLVGFSEVPVNILASIQPGTFIRYFKKGVGFRYGGYINLNPMASKRHMQLRSSLSNRCKTMWIVCYDDIEKIYVRTSITEELFKETVDALETKIEELELMVKVSSQKLNEVVTKINEQNTIFARKIRSISSNVNMLMDLSDRSSIHTADYHIV